MNQLKLIFLAVLLLCGLLTSRPGHAQSQQICDYSPTPAGWVVTGINQQINNSCTPNRQITITQIPASVNDMTLVCSDSALPANWVVIALYASNMCTPFQAENIKRTNFPSGVMCDVTSVPVGYVVNLVSINGNTCKPYREFTLAQIPASATQMNGVCGNSPLPSGWAFTSLTSGSVSCNPFQVGNMKRLSSASELMCGVSAAPTGYTVETINIASICGKYRQYSVKKSGT